jgi:FtsZ-binding cell division protein ZapB
MMKMRLAAILASFFSPLLSTAVNRCCCCFGFVPANQQNHRVVVLVLGDTETAGGGTKDSPALLATALAQLQVEFKDLKEQNKQVEERVNKFQVELKELKERAKKQEEETTNLMKRVDGVVTAFSPAVLYATMETCVYLIFDAHANFTFTVGKAKKQTKLELSQVSFQAASFAGRILDCLVTNETFTWTGFPNEKKKFMTMALEGLFLFLIVAEKYQLTNWPPDRNPLVHNGQFLSSWYPGMKETPLFQEHFQVVLAPQKPAAPLIKDNNGAALAARLLAVFNSTTFPQGIDSLLSGIERILEDEHGIMVDPSVSHDVRAWIM